MWQTKMQNAKFIISDPKFEKFHKEDRIWLTSFGQPYWIRHSQFLSFEVRSVINDSKHSRLLSFIKSINFFSLVHDTKSVILNL